MPTTATAPGTSVDISGSSPVRNVTIGESSCYAGLLVVPSIGTYGNGVIKASAYDGDSNNSEAQIEQLEILAKHPQSTTPYDVATAFTTADPAIAVTHVVNGKYWLKGSSVTAAHNDKLVCAANGLVQKLAAHTATPYPMHTWKCTKAVSAATWIPAVYIGLVSAFTSA